MENSRVSFLYKFLHKKGGINYESKRNGNPLRSILDKTKRDELVQNTELLKQVTIKPIPWLPGRDYITTEQVARFFDGDVDEVKRLCTKYRKEFWKMEWKLKQCRRSLMVRTQQRKNKREELW